MIIYEIQYLLETKGSTKKMRLNKNHLHCKHRKSSKMEVIEQTNMSEKLI